MGLAGLEALAEGRSAAVKGYAAIYGSFIVDGGAAAGTTLRGFRTCVIVKPNLARVFAPRWGREFFHPGGAGRELSRTEHLSAPACEAPQPGWTWGQALQPDLGAGLVTLLSGDASTGGPATPWRATLQSIGGPRHPADHALVALFAFSTDGGAFPSCSSLPCLLARGQVMLGRGFHTTSKTVGQTPPPLTGLGGACALVVWANLLGLPRGWLGE